MGRYILRRLIQAIPLLILMSIFLFSLVHLIPGGPDRVLLNPRLSAAGRAALRADFGLDDPLYVQYFKWVGSSLVGNFGYSLDTNQPVAQVINQRFPPTVELLLSGLILALIIAILLGTIAAVRYHTVIDYVLTTVSYFGISMPVFLFGLLSQDVFGVYLHILPVSGMSTPGYVFDPFNTFLDQVTHLILPVCVLSLSYIAGWSRYLRSTMVEVIKQDYIRTARAKGVSTTSVLARHALRNAVIPLITAVALEFGTIAGGATITEGIFAWPGMGSLFINALGDQDYPVLLAMLMIGSVFVIAFNLIADILYAVVDPRIRYS